MTTEDMGIFVLVILAIGPFALAVMGRQRRLVLEEPPFRLEGENVTAFPTCLHCRWQGALDVTEFVKMSAQRGESTVMRSPPCYKCGRRWDINLTTLVQKYRTGTFS